MLIEFSVENFLSFKDRVTLSMVASSDDALPQNVIKSAQGTGIDLLKSVAVYGANASGKSNLINAMNTFVSIIAGRTDTGLKEITPFMFDKTSSSRPSTFEVKYIIDGVIYIYGVSLDSQRIHKEWLHSYPKKQKRKLFERSLSIKNGEYKYLYGPHWKGEKKRLEKLTGPESFFLFVADKFNHEVGKKAFKWFNNLFMSYDMLSKNQKLLEHFVSFAIQEGEFSKKDVLDFFKQADLGIDDIIFENKALNKKTIQPTLFGLDFVGSKPAKKKYSSVIEASEFAKKMFENEYLIRTIHRMKNKKGDAKEFVLSFNNESDGTQKYYSLSIPFLLTLKLGLLFTADELDRHLHPLLLQTIIQMIHDETANKNGAQLIFTAHDTTILDHRLFRRDQVWFAEKDKAGATQLFSLWEIKGVKKNENLVRNYLAGRYGAIPILSGRIK